MKRDEPLSPIPALKQFLFDTISFQITAHVREKESQAYSACRFEINQLKVVYRNAKTTPTKTGQFVTLWKRIPNGPIRPLDFDDPIDLVVINTQTPDNSGQFVFPKSLLIDKGIFSTQTKEGKRGFRIYPPWVKATSPQAIRTQHWQLPYFLSLKEPIDINHVKRAILANMKTITVKELKTELGDRSHQELLEICLHLSKFKKENKELLTYLVYESDDEQGYINSIKREVDEQFELINASTYYFIKKSTRKILRRVKTYIRYSKIKETEIELLIYFCQKLKDFSPSIKRSTVLTNLHEREIASIKKKVSKLHEDLQFDYEAAIENLTL